VRLLAHFDVYNEESTEAQGATFILLDEFLNLFQRIDAENAKFSPAGVLLTNAEIKDYTGLSGQEEKSFTLKRENELFIPDFPTPPPGLGQQEEVPSEELSIQALQANISRLKSEGFYPVRQIVDLHFKISRSFITLIMIIVGLPIGFWREKGGSVALGLVPGLTLSFIYLVSLELSRTVGYAGFLPPFLAAWLPNGFFLLLGLYLFTYVRQ
jgi:lipopolysaccharide export system permease protein